MGIFEGWPYTNFQDFNLGWVLQVVQQIKTALDGDFTEYIQQWVAENYNQLFFNAAYNEGTDTLTMSLAEGMAQQTGEDPVSYIDLAGRVLEIVDASARVQLATLSAKVNKNTGAALPLANCSRCVIIGDSWTAGYQMPQGVKDGFMYQFVEMVGGEVASVIAVGGLGFSSAGTGTGNAAAYFNTQKGIISSPETVTAVFVCLGLNDRSQDGANITAGAAALFQAVKSYCPNASIVYLPNPNYSPVNRVKILNSLPSVCAANNVIYLDSYWWGLLDNSLFLDDKFHPSVAGNQFFAGCLRTAMGGGSVYHGAQFTVNGDAGQLYMIAERDTITIYGTPSIGAVAFVNLLQWDANWFKGSGSNTAPGLGWRGCLPIGNFVQTVAQLHIEPNNNYLVLKNGQTSSGTYLSGATRLNISFNAAMLLG